MAYNITLYDKIAIVNCTQKIINSTVHSVYFNKYTVCKINLQLVCQFCSSGFTFSYISIYVMFRFHVSCLSSVTPGYLIDITFSKSLQQHTYIRFHDQIHHKSLIHIDYNTTTLVFTYAESIKCAITMLFLFIVLCMHLRVCVCICAWVRGCVFVHSRAAFIVTGQTAPIPPSTPSQLQPRMGLQGLMPLAVPA